MTLHVRFRRDEDGATLEHVGLTHDLGLGGAFITTETLPEVGSRIVLLVSSASTWDPMELRAEVRWVSDAADGERGFGVRFPALSGQQASALYDLVNAARFAETPPK